MGAGLSWCRARPPRPLHRRVDVRRVAGAAFRLAYEESAVVDHFPVLNLRTFLGKNVRYGRAALRFRRLHTPGQVEPARFYLWLVRRGFREGPAIGTLVALAQAATAVGFVGEHLRGRRT
jgi:hypothetical protein